MYMAFVNLEMVYGDAIRGSSRVPDGYVVKGKLLRAINPGTTCSLNGVCEG